MELKELCKVFREGKGLFLAIVATCFGVLFVILWMTPQVFVSTVTFTITRDAEMKTSDAYPTREDFGLYYRFQADDAFAETVVAWLHTPQIVRSISAQMEELNIPFTHGGRSLTKHYETTQRSAHVIDVQYRAVSPRAAKEEARLITAQIGERAERLTGAAQASSGFKIISEESYVEPFTYNVTLLIVLTSIIALCFGVMSVLMRHYAR